MRQINLNVYEIGNITRIILSVLEHIALCLSLLGALRSLPSQISIKETRTVSSTKEKYHLPPRNLGMEYPSPSVGQVIPSSHKKDGRCLIV